MENPAVHLLLQINYLRIAWDFMLHFFQFARDTIIFLFFLNLELLHIIVALRETMPWPIWRNAKGACMCVCVTHRL